ncbi:hypothetical protein AB1K83_13455 [Sporosarcina sp. 179-K 3D1 HS]|uniref:hypothetical protein n=1 Tax=Sporosarcina sp. 179-K 3D1 HS TaxID=3232169 RepID=UPI0039A232F6
MKNYRKNLLYFSIIGGGLLSGFIIANLLMDGSLPAFVPDKPKLVENEPSKPDEVSQEIVGNQTDENDKNNASKMFENEVDDIPNFDEEASQAVIMTEMTDQIFGKLEMIKIVSDIGNNHFEEMFETTYIENNIFMSMPEDFMFYPVEYTTLSNYDWNHPDFYSNLHIGGDAVRVGGEPFPISIHRNNLKEDPEEQMMAFTDFHEMMKEEHGWEVRPTLTHLYNYPLFDKVRYLFTSSAPDGTVFYDGAFVDGEYLYNFSIRTDGSAWLDEPTMERYWAMLNTLTTKK